MKIRNLFASLLIAGSLLGCGELETRIKTYTGVQGRIAFIKRLEFKNNILDVEREILATYDRGGSKYLREEYFPVLTIMIREKGKERIYYVDEKNDGTVDAYISNGQTTNRNKEEEDKFSKYDTELKFYKELIDFDDALNFFEKKALGK